MAPFCILRTASAFRKARRLLYCYIPYQFTIVVIYMFYMCKHGMYVNVCVSEMGSQHKCRTISCINLSNYLVYLNTLIPCGEITDAFQPPHLIFSSYRGKTAAKPTKILSMYIFNKLYNWTFQLNHLDFASQSTYVVEKCYLFQNIE